ncbi:V(D)J recombination-activating protein 1-like [Amphiura filiformis]|uniref:V(D)J recombination-activating protein 1-like n=1 Tax=Amphiura filiformis TaxID=82378 RepID=UPI003B22024D
MHLWQKHDDNCLLCKKHTKGKGGGRPKKRLRGAAKQKANLAKPSTSSSTHMEATIQASQLVGRSFDTDSETSGGIDAQFFTNDTISPECICSLCGKVLLNPMQVDCCNEIFCRYCLEKWLELCSSCPKCKDYCDDESVFNPEISVLGDLYDLQYSCQTCHSVVYYSYVYMHHPKCSGDDVQTPTSSASKVGRPMGPSYHKNPLSALQKKSSKRRRVTPLRTGLRNLIRLHKEDYGDVVKYLLVDYYEMTGRYTEARELTRFFDKRTFGMSARKCLALRVACFQAKNQYQRRRTVNATMEKEVYQSIGHLNLEEHKLLPGAATFSVESSNSSYSFDSVAVSGTDPIDILAGLNPGIIRPQIAGYRWRYDQAVAQTLVEYNDDIECAMKDHSLDPSDSELILHCRIKDGSDGLGEMPVKVSKDVLPNKSIRYAFVLTHVWTVDSTGAKIMLYDEQQPNSEFWTRPLLVALCDENDSTAVGICHRPIEQEKQALSGAKMTITAENGNIHCYYINIQTKMMDEKLERVVKNLEASGSNHNCTLCEYNKATDSHVTGPVPITRNSLMTSDIGQELQFNASDRHERSLLQMKAYGKGVKPGKPLMEVSDILDSTHATINTAELIENLFDHEISEETEHYNIGQCDPIKLANAKDLRLDTLKRHFGRNRGLMMQGNLGRVLYSKRCEDVLVPLIPKPERQDVMRTFLSYMRDLRTVWVDTHPDCSPEAVARYDTMAEELGSHIREHFPYLKNWTNYLHKIISHGGELLTKYGTIGGDASEGNECQNKVFRYVQKHLSRNNAKLDIKDCLVFSWLYTSRLLRKQLSDPSQYTCSQCGQVGHNIRTCMVE